ncbi:MAG: hypothetical protein WAN30_08775 [Acidimicrobiales bacterium]
MIRVRTLRRTTEVVNLAALVGFLLLGLFVFALGVARSSVPLVLLGLAYASGTVWYLVHLVTRVASDLQFDPSSGELTWFAFMRHGHFSSTSVASVRQTFQPDVYAFVLRDGSLVRFWHRNRLDDAREFFRQLRGRCPDVNFDALYLVSKAPWRRGLPAEGPTGSPSPTRS